MKNALAVVVALAGILWGTCAFAQPVPPSNVYCLNSSGVAVPWFNAAGTWQCSGSISTAAMLAGTTSNAGSGVATSATNIPTVSYNYGFNGTTWDQLQVDGSKNLKVVFGAAQTVAVTQGTSPWVDSITTWGGGTLGAMANYGTSPGAVLVPGTNAFTTNLPTVAINVAPVTATNPAVVVGLRPDSPGIIALGQTTKSASVPVAIASDQLGGAAISSSLPVVESSQYQANNVGAAVPITAASGNVAASSAVATLSAAASKTTYISGFEISGSGATLGSCVTVTVVGTISGTLSYTYCAAAGVLVSDAPLIVPFVPAIPASAPSTPIVVTLPSLGTGNTNATVVAHGYQL